MLFQDMLDLLELLDEREQDIMTMRFGLKGEFPKKGIIFKDITTLIRRKELFRKVIDKFAKRYEDKHIDFIACVEARCFIFGGALAYKLGAGVIPIRKRGKLPHKTRAATYELEYGTDSLHIHEDALGPGHRVLIVDD